VVSRPYVSIVMMGAIVFGLSAASVGAQQVVFSHADRQALAGLIDEYSAVWEPGRLSATSVLETSRRLFDSGPDFAMVVDAYYYPTWAAREGKIPERVATSLAEGDKEAHHRTLDERVLPLGTDAAVVTRVYRSSFVDSLGKPGHQDSAATYVFVRKAGQWKIVQYHGSHGQRVADDAQNTDRR
jgi:calcium/calmodulin dependent protein kinase II association protein